MVAGATRQRVTGEGARTLRHLIGFATWVPVIIAFNSWVAEVTAVNGSSMYPFLNEDRNSTLRRDWVLTWKRNPHLGLKRGMVVTFTSPTNPDTTAIKRIVALEGDKIKTKAPYPETEVTVPQGHVWVEGDGPPGSSLDSNTYGPVSKQLLTGQVTHILYPFKNLGQIKWWEHKRPLDLPRA